MKYYGAIGFVEFVDQDPIDHPGVKIEKITERVYSGDVLRIIGHSQPASEKVTDDLKLNNQISVLLDPYALDNFANIRYVTFLNSKWEVSAVDVQYPRLVLSFGGLYHEQTT